MGVSRHHVSVCILWLLPAFVVSANSQSAETKPQPSDVRSSTPATSGLSGNEACASCHAEIYQSYAKTVMAHASGDARDGVITGGFEDKKSGVRYRVYQQNGRVWMSYQRSGDNAIRGQDELLYFIGSGVKGRTYLFNVDGFLFEAPINWYSQEERWNMTPAYTQAQEIPMNLPAYIDCLNCHTSGVQPPIAGTDCKFTRTPFQHGGISCQRCHGAGKEHIQGKGGIVNPAKLVPDRRDAICMECHFEGTAAVLQSGKQLYQFQPGEKLSDYIHYFLLSGNQPQAAQALSQTEALALSTCKRRSGDRMWCGSCHDPHYEPTATGKADYYRSKCLACHGETFAAKHHSDQRDCRSCHMPALPSKDVAHTQATDHRILRSPGSAQYPSPAGSNHLTIFPPDDVPLASPRDLALAWQNLAQRGIEGASREAAQYLPKALQDDPDDAALLSAQGYLEQERGHADKARQFYEHALRIDPLENDAASNLGILEAQSGYLRRAVVLWQAAFARVPNRSAIGMNLAMTLCAAGRKQEAEKYLARVLVFNPDYGKAKALLKNMEREPAQCSP
jgi:tetratricopeptide (TPR) repeat protein